MRLRNLQVPAVFAETFLENRTPPSFLQQGNSRELTPPAGPQRNNSRTDVRIKLNQSHVSICGGEGGRASAHTCISTADRCEEVSQAIRGGCTIYTEQRTA